MAFHTQLLDGFMNLAAGKDRYFLYEQELFYIFDYGKVSIPENIYLSYGENPEEKFKMKFYDIERKYVLKIVSKFIDNKSEGGGTVFGASPRNMEDLIAELKYNFPENYAKWVMENRDKASERYRDISDKNELITKISYDIKGFLIVEQIYYPKMFGTEFFFEVILNEDRTPSVIFGDNSEYLQYRESGEGDNCVTLSAETVDKENIEEKIQDLQAVKIVTGQEQTGLPPVNIDNITNILEMFLTVANKYSIHNSDAKWHLNGFFAVPCVSATSKIIPLKADLTFKKA